MPQTFFEFGGEGPPMHLALANGFPPETYQPLLAPLTEAYRVVCLPPRALWDTPPPPTSMDNWKPMADDLLAGLRAHDLTGVVGIGHSMGAVATIMAAVEDPARFRGIALLDPTIFPQRIFWTLRIMRWFGLQGRFPLVKKALQRRARFANRDEAFAYWREKRLFRDWDDAVLWLYVAGLTHETANGELELAWSPAWEARYYATISLDSWAYVRQLNVPTLVIRGNQSNTFMEAAASAFQRLLPEASYAEIDGHGHLFPQSAPDETRRLIQTWLETIPRL